MTLEVIFTFNESGEQEIFQFPFEPKMIATKKAFIAFCKKEVNNWWNAIGEYSEDEDGEDRCAEIGDVPELAKLSGCVYFDSKNGDDFKEPAWWKNNNGKVYFRNNS